MSLKDRIVAKLEEAGGSLSLLDLYRYFPDTPRASTRGTVNKMVSTGELVRTGAGLYALPGKAASEDTTRIPPHPQTGPVGGATERTADGTTEPQVDEEAEPSAASTRNRKLNRCYYEAICDDIPGMRKVCEKRGTVLCAEPGS
jgi:hypothetical protein